MQPGKICAGGKATSMQTARLYAGSRLLYAGSNDMCRQQSLQRLCASAAQWARCTGASNVYLKKREGHLRKLFFTQQGKVRKGGVPHTDLVQEASLSPLLLLNSADNQGGLV